MPAKTASPAATFRIPFALVRLALGLRLRGRQAQCATANAHRRCHRELSSWRSRFDESVEPREATGQVDVTLRNLVE